MKIAGIDPSTLPCESVLVLPRGDQQVVFRATGLKDMTEFNKFCPEPVPPTKLTKDGKVADTDDPDYKAAVEGHQKRHLAFMVVKSLAPSEIEWDTVKSDSPSTWTHWEDDLKAAGFTQIECNRVLSLVMEANSLDERKLEAARKNFIHLTAETSAK